MTRTNGHRIETAKQNPPLGDLDLDAYLFDDEFDDVLDRELFAIRETLTDFRND